MIYISHRVNTIEELKRTPIELGVEIDIRDKGTDLILSHDPFSDGDLFEEFIKFYCHRFIILNIKSERVEHKVLEILKKYNIFDYFFLDLSFPMLYTLNNLNEKNIAIRFSEFESIDSVLLMANKINWVWIDCFTDFPLTKEKYDLMKLNNFKICIVSPELQQQQEKIEKYADYMIENKIIPDMICTKKYNINIWRERFK